MTIVEEIRNDPQQGAKRLDSEYRAGLTTLARRICHDDGDAAELVNHTFAEVIANIDRYAEQSAFFGWMSKILVNLHAKEKRRRSNQMLVFPGEVPECVDEDATERIYREVDASLLRDAVSELPQEMRDAVVLRYFMDLPLARVAKILSVPEGTVNSRLHYARLALAAKLGATAKKPGGKAVLLALLLCGLTALGAGAGHAIVRLLSSPSAAMEQQADNSKTTGHATSDMRQAEACIATQSATDCYRPPATENFNFSTDYPQGEPMNKTQTTRAAAMLAAATVATSAALPATANTGLLYEPDSYAAQENLVLHLDGIRNAGALKAHDSTATMWVDLASSRTAAIREISSITSTSPVRKVPDPSLVIGTSGWTDDGFYFNGTSFAQMSSALTLGSTYTIQVVCDVNPTVLQNRYNDSNGVVSETSGNNYPLQWPAFVGTTDTSGDNCNIYYNCGTGEQRINAKMGNANFTVYVTKTEWNNHYLTALANGSKASLFATDYVGTKKDFSKSIGSRTLTFGASYGSSEYGAWRRSLVGTIKAIRIYDTALTDAQLAANRALDEIRFFGGIPTTNVVVATAVEGLEGNEASGAYAFDASGYTFSAPAQAALGATVYSCTGYTLETWNGSGWGEPVLHDGVLAVAISDTSALVRLTWQWAPAEIVAQDYTWMASPANANWDGTSANWNVGEAWADGNNAIFGSSSETTLTVGSERLVNDLTINNVAYTFNGAGPLRVKGIITPVGAKDQHFNVPLASGRDDGSLHFTATGVDWRSAYLDSVNNLQTSTVLGGTVFLMAKGDGSFGPAPATPAENIVIESGNPTIYGNASITIHSNRIVRIKSGAALWTGSNSPFNYRAQIVAEPEEDSDYSLDTKVKIRSNWGGLVTFDPGEGRTNAFGRLFVDTRRLKLASGATTVTGPATSTGEVAIAYVKGNGSAFSSDRGYLLIDGGELHSPKMTGDRYVDVRAFGQVVVTNGGSVIMPEGVQWINGLTTPGKLMVAKDGSFAVETLRVSQSGANPSEVHLDEGGLIAVYQLRMDNASSGLFAFNGGCLQALRETRAFYAGASASWANVAFTVGEKGAGFDLSNGVNLWWGKPLQSGVGAGETDGGLFKRGSGILVLLSANAYNGPTVLESGRIQARADHALPDGTTLRLGGGADTRLTASTYDSESPRRPTVQTLGRVEGSGELDDMTAASVTGAVAPAADGTITFMTTCTLSGDYEVTADANGCSCLKVAAGQDISGLSVKLMNIQAFDREAPRNTYKILDAPDGYSGHFALAPGFPADKWSVLQTADAAYLSSRTAFVIVVK